jgi:hypothetical protein
MQTGYFPSEIARWQLGEPDKQSVFIPRLQRSLIWNAARIEVFWDSLMRNIPVGAMVLSPISSEMRGQLRESAATTSGYFLLDGQQRANAIATAYRPFIPQEIHSAKGHAPILWLDLAPHDKADSRCAFSFYLTTTAHPWGFASRAKDRETSSDKLASQEMAAAIRLIKGPDFSEPTYRPLPHELWPVRASLPLPFTFLVNTDAATDEATFWDGVAALYSHESVKASNWYRRFSNALAEFMSHSPSPAKTAVHEAIKEIGRTQIPALYVSEKLSKDPDSIAVFFDRLNTQGVVPSPEERNYSMAKSFWPEMWNVDQYARNRMLPHRMATLALETFLTIDRKKWVSNIDSSQIRRLSESDDTRKAFSAFVSTENGPFYRLCARVDSWMGLVQDGTGSACDWALLTYHRTLVAHNSMPLYKLLLLLAHLDPQGSLSPRHMAGLITVLRWFSLDHNKVAATLFECCTRPASGFTIWQAVQQGLASSFNKELLTLPASVDDLEVMFATEITKENSYWNTLRTQFPQWRGIEGVVRGFGSSYGTELLLYSVRPFVRRLFDYDPAESEKWETYNRPWDYDHILPKNWLGSRGRSGNGPWMHACRELLWSIGNSAPIPFSMNRGKSDGEPGPDYCGRDPDLLCDYDQIAQFKHIGKESGQTLDYDSLRAMHFVQTTKDRFLRLYSEWYSQLRIADVLDIDQGVWPRRVIRRQHLFSDLLNRMAGRGSVMYVSKGIQFECKKSLDWARPWIAAGIIRDDKRDFVCVASDGDVLELGIRRHPRESSINGSANAWWHNVRRWQFKEGDPMCEAEGIMRELEQLA